MLVIFIKIYGKVQGVFFRINAQKEAQKLNLTGWVKNQINGSVEIEAQGKKDDLEKFIQWCREGSPISQVEKVDIQYKNSDKQYKEFAIRY